MNSNSHKKKAIIVAGPTAVGKTAVAIRLAQALQTEIISADSRQCYRELSIGVARPFPEELSAVPHHFIASHSIQETVSAADFEKLALAKAQEIFLLHDTVILTGGTGLYIRAFCEGFDMVPAIDPAIRSGILEQYRQQGLQWLQEAIRDRDPQFVAHGDMQNPQRMMRALEVFMGTGRPLTEFQQGNKAVRDFDIIRIGLELPRKELVARIDQRVDDMIEKGWVEEARSLYPFRDLNALQTVGYNELFAYFDGALSLPEAIEKIKTATRQYAKRQMTWFRKEPGMYWFAPGDIDTMLQLIRTPITS